MSEVTRFAPSPTGYLHVGHAYSALFAYHKRGPGGSFHLRIDDLDPARSREHFVEAIFEDLRWLGLSWETPIRRQSENMDDYNKALLKLSSKGLVYPCFCTRKEIRKEIERSGEAPHSLGLEIYPGTCKKLTAREIIDLKERGKVHALRINMAKAIAITGNLNWYDFGRGTIQAGPEKFGDIILARKEVASSYHLAVTVDDAFQKITLVSRGRDLFYSTDIHRLLQVILGYSKPKYYHHDLVKDLRGNRLSKRKDSTSIRFLRENGYTPKEVIALSGFKL